MPHYFMYDLQGSTKYDYFDPSISDNNEQMVTLTLTLKTITLSTKFSQSQRQTEKDEIM